MTVETARMALTPAEKMKRLRANRKKRGQCSRCGAKVRKGTNCNACNAYTVDFITEQRKANKE